MPISSNRAHFLPKGLPLRGPNYQISVRRNGDFGQNRQITKRGNQIAVRGSNAANNLNIQVRGDGFSYGRPGTTTTHVRENGQTIRIQKANGQNLQITKSGNQIAVDRMGVSNDVLFTQTPNGLIIDRYGVQNDVAITQRGQTVDFEYGNPSQNTRVTLPPGEELDTVAYQNEISLDPHAVDLIGKWFDEGQISATDLIVLTQRGDLVEYDDRLR